VGLRVNGMAKTFAVLGDRFWQSGLRGVTASAPQPFTVMPVSYDRAFGGTDTQHQDLSKHSAFMRNPIGVGFHKDLRPEFVDGSPLPNTEEVARAVDSPDADWYVPMSFGPLGRAWHPRFKYAGTYDEQWLENRFPFLPVDFDEQYYQAAPLDQQIPIPKGGEEITLVNLAPEGHVSFLLPVFDAPIHFFPKNGERESGALLLDTIIIEPDRHRFMLTWRATRPLKKNIFEIAQTLVGKRSREWWAERETFQFPILLMPVSTEGRGRESWIQPLDNRE
jgi:hypothetical protein